MTLNACYRPRRRSGEGCTFSPVLARVDWDKVGKTVITQQYNRELHTPVVSLYRWWARRSHALIGEILDAALQVYGKKVLHVSDPFSGGGTVTFEAVRRSLPTYAQDLYPWPSTGLAVALSRCSKNEFSASASRLLKGLDPLRSLYRRPDGRELTHILKVRLGSCPHCTKAIHLFPYPLISLISRSSKEKRALYGCRSCGSVRVGPRDSGVLKCTTCGHRENTYGDTAGVVPCPHCGFETRLRGFVNGEPDWKPVAVQELTIVKGRHRALLRPVDCGDPVDSLPSSQSVPGMKNPIPDGIETHRLIKSGLRVWGDLYTKRQAEVILTALRQINHLEVSEACKDRLAMAIIGTAEMPAFLSRWDRFHLKAFEGLANHHYADTTLVVETNPLSPVGRGTIPHRLASAEKALDWTLREVPHCLPVRQLPKVRQRMDFAKEVIVATGNSARQGLKDETVDLVLTDPPYYNCVQYGELARLFHFWLSKYRRLPAFEENEEAVPNQYRGNGSEFYVRSIAACFKECTRTLVPGGRLIFTFHNKRMPAWIALCTALVKVGLTVRSLAIIRSENEADHGKRNGKGMLYDLVLECVRRSEWNGRSVIAFKGYSKENQELLAMGVALAKAVRVGAPETLLNMYLAELKRHRIKKSAIR